MINSNQIALYKVPVIGSVQLFKIDGKYYSESNEGDKIKRITCDNEEDLRIKTGEYVFEKLKEMRRNPDQFSNEEYYEIVRSLDNMEMACSKRYLLNSL